MPGLIKVYEDENTFFLPPPVVCVFCRKSVLSLNELGQMNGTAEGGGGLSEDKEMPEQHELGEELAFTGR